MSIYHYKYKHVGMCSFTSSLHRYIIYADQSSLESFPLTAWVFSKETKDVLKSVLIF